MDTTATDKQRTRRHHSPALKAQILAECNTPGASVAKMAMARGINDNIVHGWRKLARDAARPALAAPAVVAVRVEAAAACASAAMCDVNTELRRGPLSVHIVGAERNLTHLR